MMSPPPVRRQVRVKADPARAFAVFTEAIGRWWPLDAGRSVFGAGGSVFFDKGEIVEVGPQGDRAVWGTVTKWEAGPLVGFTWHPGTVLHKATHVEVRFEEQAPGETLVTLEHRFFNVRVRPWHLMMHSLTGAG